MLERKNINRVYEKKRTQKKTCKHEKGEGWRTVGNMREKKKDERDRLKTILTAYNERKNRYRNSERKSREKETRGKERINMR